MDNPTLTIDALISHRFRGFAKRENTLEGLKAALDFGVVNLEFDVRVAACGTPMIYHDEYALDKTATDCTYVIIKCRPTNNWVGGLPICQA